MSIYLPILNNKSTQKWCGAKTCIKCDISPNIAFRILNTWRVKFYKKCEQNFFSYTYFIFCLHRFKFNFYLLKDFHVILLRISNWFFHIILINTMLKHFLSTIYFNMKIWDIFVQQKIWSDNLLILPKINSKVETYW